MMNVWWLLGTRNLHAGLYIIIIAPSAIMLAVDRPLILPIAWISPVVTWAVVFHCCGVWSRSSSSWVSPVVHTEVIVTHWVGDHSTIYRYTLRHDDSSTDRTRCPNCICSTFYLEGFLFFRNRFLLLR